MHYTVIKHDRHLRTRGKVENMNHRWVFPTVLECSLEYSRWYRGNVGKNSKIHFSYVLCSNKTYDFN